MTGTEKTSNYPYQFFYRGLIKKLQYPYPVLGKYILFQYILPQVYARYDP